MKSSLCDFSGVNIRVIGTITIAGEGPDDNAKWLDKRNKGVLFKDCAPFIDCLNEINNTQIDIAKDLDIVLPVYNFIEYRNNYLKTSESLW